MVSVNEVEQPAESITVTEKAPAHLLLMFWFVSPLLQRIESIPDPTVVIFKLIAPSHDPIKVVLFTIDDKLGPPIEFIA